MLGRRRRFSNLPRPLSRVIAIAAEFDVVFVVGIIWWREIGAFGGEKAAGAYANHRHVLPEHIAILVVQ